MNNDDPRVRLMARGAFPMLDGMDSQQVESHRRKWIVAVEALGENWVILRKHAAPQGVILLAAKVGAR